eukprot:gene15216-14620_t
MADWQELPPLGGAMGTGAIRRSTRPARRAAPNATRVGAFAGACGNCLTDSQTCGQDCGGACKKDDDCAGMKCVICGDDKHPHVCVGFTTDPKRNATLIP